MEKQVHVFRNCFITYKKAVIWTHFLSPFYKIMFYSKAKQMNIALGFERNIVLEG